MDLPLLGSLALGFVVGYLATWFISKQTDWSAPNLAAFLAIMLGGAAVEFLAQQMGAKAANYGAYAIGLAIGLIVFLIVYYLQNRNLPQVFRFGR